MKLISYFAVVLSITFGGCTSFPRVNTYDTKWVVDSVIKEEKSIEVISYSRCVFAYVKKDTIKADFNRGVCVISNDGLIFQSIRKVNDIPGNSEFTLDGKSRFDNKIMLSAGYVEFKNLFTEKTQIQLTTYKGIVAIYFEKENELGFDNKYAKKLFDHYIKIIPKTENQIVEIEEVYRPNLFIYGGTSKGKNLSSDSILILDY